VSTVQRVNVLHPAQFRGHRSNRCWDMAIFSIFQNGSCPPSWIVKSSKFWSLASLRGTKYVIVPNIIDGPHLIHDSVDSSEPTTQRVSVLVQPFLLTTECPYTLQWAAPPPSKLPLPMGNLYPHLRHGSLVHPNPQSKRYLDRLSRFCYGSVLWQTDRQIDRQTTLLGR